MNTEVPVIYVRPPASRLSWGSRLIALGVAMGSLALLVTAAALQPSPTGIGTHTRMGFGRCAFEARTGIPCPTCGMTTSFAHFVRGHLAASVYVQPAGFLLALASSMTLWAGLYLGLTGRPAHRLLRVIRPGAWMALVFTLMLLGWAWKIFIHVYNIDGWKAS